MTDDIVLAVFTDGRVDCIVKTLDSFDAQVYGPIARRIIFDDSGDPTYAQWLGERYAGWAVLSSGTRLGFGGNIARAWQVLADGPERWVFHLEDDFVFLRPVDLTRMIEVLVAEIDLVQMALVRDPVNDEEIRAGGLIASMEHRGIHLEHEAWLGHRWISHRGFWTTNPSLYPTSMCRWGWPDGAESEGHFTRRVVEDPANRFGYWGAGDAWVEHIGAERVGTGY